MIIYYGPLALLLTIVALSALSETIADMFGIHEQEMTVFVTFMALLPIINILFVFAIITSAIGASRWYRAIEYKLEKLFKR